MAADLHIHVFTDGELTEPDFRAFFNNNLGSKWCGTRRPEDPDWRTNFEKFSETPSVWVGEVSWLKAGLLENPERYIPNAVGKVSEIIGEDLPVVDDQLILRIKEALGLANATPYEVSSADKVVSFLKDNKGKKAFTVSW